MPATPPLASSASLSKPTSPTKTTVASTALALVAVAAALVAAPSPAAAAIGGANLNTLFVAKGKKFFGTATDNPELTNAAYVSILNTKTEFGQVTPGNSQKVDATEPTQNVFAFTNGDTIVNQAIGNGQLVRCHTLVWHSQLPAWITGGTWTNATLIAAMQNHIKNVVTHYKGKCYSWDVVNEAFNDDGTYRQSIWFNTIGKAYIPLAFQFAAMYDPAAKLYYNDFSNEFAGAKSSANQQLVRELKAAGVRIDGVGFQSHFISGSTPSYATQLANMNAFTALGVEVAITELDVRIQLPTTAAKLTQQANDYVASVKACVDTPGCVSVTVWDFFDTFSWVPSVFAGFGAACLYDANLQPKPAYTALASLLAGGAAAAAPATTTTTTTTAAAVAAPSPSPKPTTTASPTPKPTSTPSPAPKPTTTATPAPKPSSTSAKAPAPATTTTTAAAAVAAPAPAAAGAAADRTLGTGITGSCWGGGGAAAAAILQLNINPPPAAERGLASYTIAVSAGFTISQQWPLNTFTLAGNTLSFTEVDDQPNPGLVMQFGAGVDCVGGLLSPPVTATVAATSGGKALMLAFTGTGLTAAAAAAAGGGGGAAAPAPATTTTAAAAAPATGGGGGGATGAGVPVTLKSTLGMCWTSGGTTMVNVQLLVSVNGHQPMGDVDGLPALTLTFNGATAVGPAATTWNVAGVGFAGNAWSFQTLDDQPSIGGNFPVTGIACTNGQPQGLTLSASAPGFAVNVQ
ncbi:glycoside hydrolase superfamily [Zopfochytrium polystomum]|nr:glycoside hydrolase superfamily [Zopfochytrium polystomum]